LASPPRGIVSVQLEQVAVSAESGEFSRLEDDRPVQGDDHAIAVGFQERARVCLGTEDRVGQPEILFRQGWGQPLLYGGREGV
jgi:hypothetical protein